jgi:5-formyltetrahydrofolate cyclo-ligase
MRSNDLKRAKRRVRREVLAIRDRIPSDRRTAMGESITRRFLALPEVASARSVLVFWSFGSEVPTGPLIEELVARDVVAALPRIADAEVEAVPYRPGDPTRSTSFGAEEPVDGVPIPAEAIDVVAVPGVAFDRRGHRIGYGGGFYDRFFRRTDATPIAIAFSAQVLDGELPTGAADVPVSAIVTEAETIRTRGSADLNSRSTS